MNKTFLLILRVILFLIVAAGVYQETGPFTTIAIAIIYGGDEYYSFNANRIMKRMTTLQSTLDLWMEQAERNKEAVIQKFDEYTKEIIDTLDGKTK